MAPADHSSAERDNATADSNSTAEAQDQDVFVNPLPAAAMGTEPGPDSEPAPQHPPVSSAAAQPHSATDAAPAAAHLPAEPLPDDDADVDEAHALLPQRHALLAAQASVDADSAAHRASDVQAHGRDNSDGDSESVSLDSPAAGRPPDSGAATMANPYFQIHGALRNPLEEQPHSETDSSRGHKVC
jgi:hypothetical protein